MVIDTPNGQARNIVSEGAEWEGFIPFHIWLFSPTNLERLLARHGLVVERSFSYKNRLRDRPAATARRRLRVRILRALLGERSAELARSAWWRL